MLRLTHGQQNLLLLNFLYTVYNIIQAKEYRPSFCTSGKKKQKIERNYLLNANSLNEKTE